MLRYTALRIVVIAILWVVVSGFSLYSYGPPVTVSRMIEYNNWGKPDSHMFAVIVYHKKYRWPTGIINSFPDGGNVKTIRHWVSIYACDADSRTAKKITEINIAEDYRINTSISLSSLWLDDTFFLTVKGYEDSLRNNLWGDLHGATPNNVIYALTLDGAVGTIDAIPVSAREHVPRSERSKADYKTDYSRKFVWLAVNWFHVKVNTDESPREGSRRFETMFVLDKDSGELIKNPEIALFKKEI